MKRRALGYSRISDLQKKNEHSHEDQERVIRELAYESGFELVEVGRETFSGARPKRPVLEEYVERLRRNEADVIIVAYVDRLSREDEYDALNLIKEIESIDPGRTEVVAGDHRLDDESAEAGLTLGIKVAVNAYQRKSAKQRSAKTTEALRRKGTDISRPPIGYDRKRDAKHPDGWLVPNEDAPAIRKIFEMYAAGKPFGEIKDFMAKKGLLYAPPKPARVREAEESGRPLPQPQPRSTAWIQRQVRNRHYLGESPPARDENGEKPVEWVKGDHDGIVSQTLFDECAGRRPRENRPRVDVGGIAQGVIRCEKCGELLTRQNPRKHNETSSYGCWTEKVDGNKKRICRAEYDENGKLVANRPHASVPLVDNYIRAAINQAAADGTLKATMSAEENRIEAQKLVDLIMKDLKGLRTTASRRAYDSNDEWLDAVRGVERELGAAQARLRKLAPNDLVPRPGWEQNLTHDEQRQMVRQLAEEITLGPLKGADGKARRIQDRVKIKWYGYPKFDEDGARKGAYKLGIAKRIDSDSPEKLRKTRWNRDLVLLTALQEKNAGGFTLEEFMDAADISVPDVAHTRLARLQSAGVKVIRHGDPRKTEPKTYTVAA